MKHRNPTIRRSGQCVDDGMPMFVSPTTTLAICVMVFAILYSVAPATERAERVAIDGLLGINAALYVAAAWFAHAAIRARMSLQYRRLARYANKLSIAGQGMTMLGTFGLALLVAIRA